MSAQPSVVLLEDDPSVQRFVQLALEDLPLQLHCSASLAQAREVLRRHPAQLLLADLNLPDGSGLALCQELQTQPSAPLVVIFSGGVDAALERQLRQAGVWQVLHKPVAVGQLLACVEQALAQPARTPCAAAAPAATDPVHTFFGGQQALYQAYRQTCLAQFEHDLAQGAQAAQAGDCTALRHLGHNLKSVLTLLGHDGAAQLARTLEAQASTPDLAAATHSWQQLAQALQQLR